MQKDLEYYLNQKKKSCITIPSRESKSLVIDKYLSEFGSEDEKQLARDNLGITEKLELLKTLIDNKIIEYGGLLWDLEPTVGNTNHALSSDAIFRVLQNYYTKQGIEDKLQNLWERAISYLLDNIPIDDQLSLNSENSVQNKVITQALQNYQEKLESGQNIKTIEGETLLGEGNIDLHLERFVTALGLSGLLKTINGQSIVGEGNITIEGGSGGGITMEDVENYLNPLKITASISPSLSEYTGNNIQVTISVSVKKGNKNVTPDILQVTLPNGQIQNIGTVFTAQIKSKGTSTFTINGTYKEESDSTQVRANLVLPTYVGFSSSATPNEVILANLQKNVVSSLSMNKTLQNSTAGNYLWIATPLELQMVATDPGFTYRVGMNSKVVYNGLNYYRSSDQIDVSNLTYYIK